MVTKHVTTGRNKFYGYGWILGTSTIASCDFISHGGQQNGYRSELWYFPKHELMIVMVSNLRYQQWTSDPKRPSFLDLKNNIVRMVIGLHADMVEIPMADQLATWIRELGVDSALARYRSMKSHPLPGYYFSEIETNDLGYYHYLTYKDFDIAHAIFEQNIADYPMSFNVYDSMAWLFDQTGDIIKAGVWYRKAVEVFTKYPDENTRWKKGMEKAKLWLSNH